MPVTRRELSILAVAVADLERRGYHPWTHEHVVQVEPRQTAFGDLFCPIRTRTLPGTPLSKRMRGSPRASSHMAST